MFIIMQIYPYEENNTLQLVNAGISVYANLFDCIKIDRTFSLNSAFKV